MPKGILRKTTIGTRKQIHADLRGLSYRGETERPAICIAVCVRVCVKENIVKSMCLSMDARLIGGVWTALKHICHTERC